MRVLPSVSEAGNLRSWPAGRPLRGRASGGAEQMGEQALKGGANPRSEGAAAEGHPQDGKVE